MYLLFYLFYAQESKPKTYMGLNQGKVKRSSSYSIGMIPAQETSQYFDILQQAVSELMLAFTLSATIFIEQPRDTFNDTWRETLGSRGRGGVGVAESRKAALSM